MTNRHDMTTRLSPGEVCCVHSSADHEGYPQRKNKLIGKCTVPDCKCDGWKPRRKTGRRK